jgi:hypothetical protein
MRLHRRREARMSDSRCQSTAAPAVEEDEDSGVERGREHRAAAAREERDEGACK